MSLDAALFWDLDGTLLLTGRAGLYAYEDAVLEVTGTKVDLSSLATPGMTEAGVATLLLEQVGVAPDEDNVERLIRAYEGHLPQALPRRQGRVLDGVREVLEDLADRPNVRSYLLTGNTAVSARAKLSHYGLDRFFPEEGAFCIDRGSRVDIARRALPLAGNADRIYVIGDTPADVECGKAIDARTIAVASGWHSAQELAEHEPWLLLERIPEPGRFRELLEIA